MSYSFNKFLLDGTDLDIADVNNLQSILDNVATNPYTPSTARIVALETKTQNITADADFTVFSDILQAPDVRTNTIADIIGDGATIDLTQTSINMYVPTLDPILTLNDKPIISTPYSGNIKSNSVAVSNIYDYNQGISIDLNATTVNVVAPYLNFNDEPVIHQNYPSYIQASSFKKTGAINGAGEYLMSDGSTIKYSQNSGNSNFYLYNNVNGASPPPGGFDGKVSYNNSGQSSATIVYITHLTRDNIDIEIFYSQISSINDLYIQDQENSENFIKYNITAASYIANQYLTCQL
jgi:hypothetical protein